MQDGFIGEIQCSRPKLVNGSENRCSVIFDKKYDECRWFRSYSRYGLRYERPRVTRKIPARDQAAEACLREPASQLPRREHRQPRAHHAGGSHRRLPGVIDSNDFNLFTRCFRKLFRKERTHLLGRRCHGKSEGKDKYREDELLPVMHPFFPFRHGLRQPEGPTSSNL